MARKECGKEFFMEIEGRQRAVLTGCSGIDTYAEDHVALRTSWGSIMIYGMDLELGCMTADGATISGILQRIEWQ